MNITSANLVHSDLELKIWNKAFPRSRMFHLIVIFNDSYYKGDLKHIDMVKTEATKSKSCKIPNIEVFKI